MNYEVKFKFKIDIDIWKKIDSKLPREREITITHESDTYYDNDDLFKLALQDKALRIRKTEVRNGDSVKSTLIDITYKGPKLNIKSKTRKELNLVIDDLDGFDYLFQELNLKPIKTVNKIRITHVFKIEENIELKLSLDHIHGLGYYVELETFTDNIETIPFIETKLMEYWFKLLKISDVADEKPRISIRESYLELIIKG